MPNQDPASLASPTNTSWMDNIPGGDVPLDQLFPNEPVAQVVSTEPLPTTAQASEPVSDSNVQSQPEPAAPVAQPFELRTKTGTVYKNSEEAIRGIETKDALIENLRQRYILERGVDPITNQPVRVAPGQPEGPVNYLQDNKKYMADLAKAVESNDPNAYFQAQSKLVFDLLQPIAPIIQEFAKEKAVKAVSSELKDFQEFRTSPDFNAVLTENPNLKSAIEGAEQDFRFHGQLPELYRVAYLAAQGRRLPELIKAAQQHQQPAAQPVRPTTVTSTLAPPNTPSKPFTQSEVMTNSDARKQFMEAMKAAGIENQVF